MSHCRLKRYIKKYLRFSYKRGWSRPPKYSTQSIKQVKALFWNEIIRMLDNQEILFSVDEASFDRNIKQHYSWLPIGKSWQIINDNFRGKVNLVVAMSNKSTWMAMMKNQTMNSICFWVFLKLLEKAVVSTMPEGVLRPSILVDNARTHTSITTKKLVRTSKLNYRFLPPYWPEVAPVERTFRYLKSKLRRFSQARIVSFGKESGIRLISNYLHHLSRNDG